MKARIIIVFVLTLIMLGWILVYSQTGHPERAGVRVAKEPAYGVGLLEFGEIANWSMMDTNPYLLVTPFEIDRKLGKWVIIDLRDRASYEGGHIPGAIHLGDRAYKLFLEDKVIAGRKVENIALRSVQELEEVFRRAGITHAQTLVLYGDTEDIMSGLDFVPFFVLEYLGHKDVRWLDGGFGEWQRYGRPIDTKPHELPPSDFQAKVNKGILATKEEVLKIALGEVKDVQLIDTRRRAEHAGRFKAPGGHPLYDYVARAGRIPNTTTNIPHAEQCGDMEVSHKLKSMPKLANYVYGPENLDRLKRAVVYSYLGPRSAFTYFTLRLLGFEDPAVYYNGWMEWGNDLNLPIEPD